MENTVLRTHFFLADHTFELVQGDMTQERVDAIVNAANSQLNHGGGIAGAISKRGGPEIQAESDAWIRKHGPVSHAEPAYTGAGRLPCRYVIHAVGPRWGDGDEDAKLAAAVSGSLRLADKLQLASLAFPAISTGIFGFPLERATGVILGAVEDYFSTNPTSGLKQVRLTILPGNTLDAFAVAWDRRWKAA